MTSKKIHVNLCVIGAGSAGLSVAAGAVQLGFDVALIERGEMGGDCLNTGCVPSKSLLAAAKHAHAAGNGGGFGVITNGPDIHFAAVNDHIRNVIRQIAPHDSHERFEGLGVKVFRETAKFIAEDTVLVGGHSISADYFVIAAGSRPRIPDLPSLENDKILTNETIFQLRERPAHLIIVGGGPIGIEMAQAHRRLGSKVSVIDQGHILPRDDEALVDDLRAELSEEGVKFYEQAEIHEIIHGDQDVQVKVQQGGDLYRLDGSHILIAAGRVPNTDTLALEKADIEYDEKGIKTDRRMRTSNKKIFAAGDIAGGPQFTHVAAYQAGIIIRNMMFKWPAKVDYSALPWVTYTTPELAQVGMTEEKARAQYGDSIRILEGKLKENDRAMAEHSTQGRIKVIATKKGKVLGASILAPHAGELINLWTLAIKEKIKISALADMIMPYPTYSEISKRMAGSFYTDKLFSGRTRFVVDVLQKLPF